MIPAHHMLALGQRLLSNHGKGPLLAVVRIIDGDQITLARSRPGGKRVTMVQVSREFLSRESCGWTLDDDDGGVAAE